MDLSKLFGMAVLSGLTVYGLGPVVRFYNLGRPDMINAMHSDATAAHHAHGEAVADLRIPGLDIARSAKLRNCAMIPASEKSGLTNEWTIDCASPYSESGQYLIRAILMNETARAFGLRKTDERRDDRHFRAFTG